MHAGVSVAGHVPHMGDSRRALAAASSGVERTAVRLAIPKRNASMVTRMKRRLRDDFPRESIGCGVTGNLGLAAVLPNLEGEERFGFEIIWKLFNDLLQIAHILPILFNVVRFSP